MMRLIAMLICLIVAIITPSPTSYGSDRQEMQGVLAQMAILNSYPTELKILATEPKGSPVDPRYLRCDFGHCSGYGMRLHPVYKRVKLHKGIDLSAARGLPVTATSFGTVSRVQRKRFGYGKNVKIKSHEYQTLYGHLDSITVTLGQTVSYGDTIGFVGSTGTSTAPHVHYEVIKKQNNGSWVSVNPLPYITRNSVATL